MDVTITLVFYFPFDSMKTIPLKEVKSIVLDMFCLPKDAEFKLTASGLNSLAQAHDITVHWQEIDLWKYIEWGNVDFDMEMLETALYFKYNCSSDILLIDNSLNPIVGFQVKCNGLESFENQYIKKFDSRFSGDYNYLFINPQQRLVSGVHPWGDASQFQIPKPK